MEPTNPQEQQQNPQPAGIPANDPYQGIEIGFIRKRDGQIMYVKLSAIFRQFKTADFINNEIVLSGEVCRLDSFQQKPEMVTLSVVKNASGGDGTYTVGGTVYNSNHDFSVIKGTPVAITISPDTSSMIDTVIDGSGTPYIPDNGLVSVTVNAAMTLTITFKSNIV